MDDAHTAVAAHGSDPLRNPRDQIPCLICGRVPNLEHRNVEVVSTRKPMSLADSSCDLRDAVAMAACILNLFQQRMVSDSITEHFAALAHVSTE